MLKIMKIAGRQTVLRGYKISHAMSRIDVAPVERMQSPLSDGMPGERQCFVDIVDISSRMVTTQAWKSKQRK
jgi:hypothetical protein